MTRFTSHKRNHSFPPAITYSRSLFSALRPPLPDIDDEPWVHFLSTPNDDEQYEDYLHFDAGILTSGESTRKKVQKFRPHQVSERVPQHHGFFSRRRESHEWHHPDVTSQPMEPYHIPSPVRVDPPILRPRHQSGRTLSGHRHSWQMPSIDLFTVDEELPRIVVSDYDVSMHGPQRSDSVVELLVPAPHNTKTSVPSPAVDETAQSPWADASPSEDRLEVEFHQMQFAERARL